MATLRHQVANVVSVLYTAVNLTLKKVVYPRNLHFCAVERFSPNVVVDVDRNSEIWLGKKVSIHSGSRIVATSGGCIKIGDRTSFNVGCIVVCKERVEIGKKVSFGPNVMIYDHDHTMSEADGVKHTPYKLGEVTIGDNTWVGAGAIILRGTHIGKNCVIAAGSVVKGDVPDGTLLVQRRENIVKRIV